VENSRRRVELLHSLLFAMPGTPIIYYGDEIGMGDNIYLGDRNGVRTPMQWSSDRNGGFSRADPARLFAPPIQDPVYGYQSINVEAQERYPFSLLNWTKRLIAMRKQHRVFGRGSLEFVASPNRKVLAFLRRDAQETILVVANLSRTVQPAELDLKAFAGLIPIEMAGLTEFPRIGEQPYFLTLGPYASYWFTLVPQSIQVAPRATAPADPRSAIAEALPALLMGVDWNNVFDAGTRTVLERQALAPFLRRQRWFSAKSREIRQARFTDWTAAERGRAFITIASVEFTDGGVESYLVPLALLSGDPAARAIAEAPSIVIAKITGARKGAIVDGLFDDETCAKMLGLAERGEELATKKASIKGQLFSPQSPIRDPQWTRPAGDQSNSVAFFGDRSVLKLFRRLEPGTNPELEIGRYLAARKFTRTPALQGAIEYLRPDLQPGTLAVVQSVVKHQGSGWDFTIDELRRYYERVGARANQSTVPSDPASSAVPPPFFAALEGWYLTTAATLGRRTAELHLTLADTSDPAFVPEPINRAALDALAHEMRDHAEAAMQALQRSAPTLRDDLRALAEEVLAQRPTILAEIDRLRSLDSGGTRIRVHGDYHLGQVLRTEEDFVILDFEGEPARSIAERRAKHSPLKHVAGMMRSYSYASHAALLAFATNSPEQAARLEVWADAWQHWSADAFLGGYLSAPGAAELTGGDAARRLILRAFMMDKALYELAYELDNRPDWVGIPLSGIRKLVRQSV